MPSRRALGSAARVPPGRRPTANPIMHRLSFRLALGFLFVLSWENAVFISSVGTLSRILGLLLIGAWSMDHFMHGGFRRLRRFHILAFLFFLWNAVSIFWAESSQGATQKSWTYLQLLALALVVWDLFDTAERLRMGLQWFVLGSYVTVGTVVYNSATAPVLDVTTVRASSINANPNEMAIVVLLALGVAWHLTRVGSVYSGKTIRLLNLGFLPAGVVAIGLSGSRTAVLSLIPILIYVASTLRRAAPSIKLGLLAAVVAAASLIQMVVPYSTVQRLTTTTDQLGSGDFNGRMEIWIDGVDIVLEHPLLGVGSGSYKAVSKTGQGAHNVPLAVTAETGVVGAVLFLSMIATVYLAAERLRKNGNGLWMALFWAWGIGVLAHSWEAEKYTWILFALTIAAADVLARGGGDLPRRRTPRSTAEPPGSGWRPRPQYRSRLR